VKREQDIIEFLVDDHCLWILFCFFFLSLDSRCNTYGDFMPEERVSHVKKEEVDALLTKAAQLLARVKEDGVKQSLAEEAANIKAATEKENADLDEAKTQLEDLS